MIISKTLIFMERRNHPWTYGIDGGVTPCGKVLRMALERPKNKKPSCR